MDFIDVM